uniref:Uncharacterized protein n=1 Tax=Utricularia reniformis TaxID=192314 RepID=A0A1Y0B015_9LAMI|nr:hypothetical protein AEK19_MT0464 [Utricularia reniformis]ART30724.1 hypothetical protein AEK19_MT0464 [Utricularia reniformis]
MRAGAYSIHLENRCSCHIYSLHPISSHSFLPSLRHQSLCQASELYYLSSCCSNLSY